MSDYWLHSPPTSYVAGWILLISTVAVFSTIAMMCGAPNLTADPLLISLRTIATWRYTWGFHDRRFASVLAARYSHQ
jgi:hypothetical protein